MDSPDRSNAAAPWLRGCLARREYGASDDYIRPAPGSEVEIYEPIAEDARERKEGRGLLADLETLFPYADAMGGRAEVSRRLRAGDGAPAVCQWLDRRNAAPERAAAFASRWGLLGLMLHSLVRMEYVPTSAGAVRPRSAPPDDMFPTVEERLACRTVLPARKAPWHTEESRQAACAAWYADRQCRGWVRTYPPWFTGEAQLDLEQHHDFYFPGLRRNPDFPHSRRAPILCEEEEPTWPALHSPELWDLLCEPLGAFWGQVEEFGEAVRWHAAWAKEGQRDSRFAVDFEQRIRKHLDRTHVEMFCMPADGAGEKDRREGVVYPSLLALAYWLLARDSKAGRGPRPCKNCGRILMSRQPKVDHCDDDCRDKAGHRRRYRRGKGEGK